MGMKFHTIGSHLAKGVPGEELRFAMHMKNRHLNRFWVGGRNARNIVHSLVVCTNLYRKVV